MANPGNDAALERELAGLKSEYERLKEDKVRTEQNLKHVSEQLRELEEKAQADYGTADPEKLEALLAEKRAENERLVGDYRRHIESIKAELSAVEREAGGEANG